MSIEPVIDRSALRKIALVKVPSITSAPMVWGTSRKQGWRGLPAKTAVSPDPGGSDGVPDWAIQFAPLDQLESSTLPTQTAVPAARAPLGTLQRRTAASAATTLDIGME